MAAKKAGAKATQKTLESSAIAGISSVGTDARIIPGIEGVVSGGSSKKLGENMMESMGLKRSTKWTGYEAQHIIPTQMKKHPVLQKMGMDLDDATNGMFLRKPGKDVSTKSRHSGYHSVYNKFVEGKLDEIDINQNSIDIQNQVFELQRKLQKLQERGLPMYKKDNNSTIDLWQKNFDNLN
ncbi:MAG: hypothetical protein HFJ06_14795 [Lachnospiraceae bacterium]|nr:hypothetical protein [Lachnospiraceae bacterium]